MAQTIHVERRDGESWNDVASAFMRFCMQRHGCSRAGCFEGDQIGQQDVQRYAAISIPNHSLQLVDYLREWASSEGRNIYEDA
jgi:hypothetical protein